MIIQGYLTAKKLSDLLLKSSEEQTEELDTYVEESDEQDDLDSDGDERSMIDTKPIIKKANRSAQDLQQNLQQNQVTGRQVTVHSLSTSSPVISSTCIIYIYMYIACIYSMYACMYVSSHISNRDLHVIPGVNPRDSRLGFL